MALFSKPRGREPAIDLLPPETPRPQRRSLPVLGDGRVSDAEFVTLSGRSFGGERAGAWYATADLAARRAAGSPQPLDAGGPGLRLAAFWYLVVALSAASFWVMGGHALAN